MAAIPSAAAKSVSRLKSNFIGVLLPHSNSEYFLEIPRVVFLAGPHRLGIRERGLDRGECDLLVLERLHARYSDRADQVAVDDDRQTALGGNERKRSIGLVRTLDPFLP